VRLALERGWDLVPAQIFPPSFARLRSQGADLVLDDHAALTELESFMADRLAYHLGQEGVLGDAVRAAIAAKPGGLATTASWARALDARRADADLARAATAATRCRRIVAGSESGLTGFVSVGDPDEDALGAALDAAEPAIAAARDAGDPDAAISAAATLCAPVDVFFEAVMVNAEDPADRDRRHALVRRAESAYAGVADFTVLVIAAGGD
jgi:glycyl-tRNA synthetase beta chain